MPMTHSEAGRLSRLSKTEMEKRIEAFCAPYRPKILEQKQENGYTYTRYDKGYTEGSNCPQWIKSTARNGDWI